MNNKQRNTSRTASDNKPTLKKKWLALTAVGIALLLIPRRSSRKDSSFDAAADAADSVSDHTAKNTRNTSNNHKANNHKANNEATTDSID